MFSLITSVFRVSRTYLLNPCLWMSIPVIKILWIQLEWHSILKFYRVRRWYLGNSSHQTGLLIGGFQVALLIIVELFAGFGTSSYSFTPLLMLMNLFFINSSMAGIEISRAYLIKRGLQSKRYSTTCSFLIETKTNLHCDLGFKEKTRHRVEEEIL